MNLVLARLLCDGTNDFRTAYRAALNAARKGHTGAQYWIARELATGENVRRNRRSAARWYRRAARRGSPAAQYNLGMMYFEGDGVAKNAALARRWIVRAAEQGEILAIMLLADAYATGELGFPLDPRRAAYWRRQMEAKGSRTRRPRAASKR